MVLQENNSKKSIGELNFDVLREDCICKKYLQIKLLSFNNAFLNCFSSLNPTYAIPLICCGTLMEYGLSGLKNCLISFFLDVYGNPFNCN